MLSAKKRKKISYKKIFDYFVKNNFDGFEDFYGLKKEAIEKIGIKKFVDSMGWETLEDTAKWSTDVFHLVVCPDCYSEFGIYEEYGLCKKCIKNYDIRAIHEAHYASFQNDHGFGVNSFLYAFLTLKPVRNLFIKGENAHENRSLYAIVEKEGFLNDVRLLEDLRKGDVVQFVLKSGKNYKEDNHDVFVVTADPRWSEEDQSTVLEYEVCNFKNDTSSISAKENND